MEHVFAERPSAMCQDLRSRRFHARTKATAVMFITTNLVISDLGHKHRQLNIVSYNVPEEVHITMGAYWENRERIQPGNQRKRKPIWKKYSDCTLKGE
jgi:ATP/maltotriose-dependent transcriptional regulator MalT